MQFCEKCKSMMKEDKCTNKRCGSKTEKESGPKKVDFDELSKDEDKYGGGWCKGGR
jgi:hypothetical protein